MSSNVLGLPLRARRLDLWRRLPIEAWTCVLFLLIWGIGVACGLPISKPSIADLEYVNTGFITPLIVAASLQVLVVAVKGWRERKVRGADPFLMLKMLPVMSITIFVYFNLKAWMPLVNPRLYDATYQQIDLLMWPLVQWCLNVRTFVASFWSSVTSADIDSLYLGLYLLMFLLSPVVHSLTDSPRRQRRVILGACLIMLLGGLTYWVAPAVGPFIYREGLNARCVVGQNYMYELFRHVYTTGTIPHGYFTAPVAAMPSLHIAHTLFFTLCAARSARGLLILYLPAFLWTVIESVASGWHYLVDLPIGAALALLCLYAVRRLIPDDPVENELT